MLAKFLSQIVKNHRVGIALRPRLSLIPSRNAWQLTQVPIVAKRDYRDPHFAMLMPAFLTIRSSEQLASIPRQPLPHVQALIHSQHQKYPHSPMSRLCFYHKMTRIGSIIGVIQVSFQRLNESMFDSAIPGTWARPFQST